MIVTDLAHLSQQAELSPALAMALAYLEQVAGQPCQTAGSILTGQTSMRSSSRTRRWPATAV